MSRVDLLGCALLLMAAEACGSDARPIARENRPHAAALSLPAGIESVDAGKLLRMAAEPQSRGLLVNVWASWCGSCKQEVPMLIALRDKLAQRGMRMVFVSADEAQDASKALELAQGWRLGTPVMTVTPGGLGNFKRALSVEWHGGIPATFLLDAQGKLRHFWEGPILEEEIAPVVEAFMAGDNVDGITRTAAEPG